jgi:hypothetical protein
VIGHDPRHDRQAQAGPAPLRGEVGQEELLAVARRDPPARVGDLDRDSARAVGETDFDLALRTAGLECVVDQVDQDALDLVRVEQHPSAVEVRLDSDGDAVARSVEQADGRLRELLEVDRLRLHFRQAGEAGELVDE